MENKQNILNLLLPTLIATDNLHDLMSLQYDDERGIVIATFVSGYAKIANVAADSGTSMIRDVIGQIV